MAYLCDLSSLLPLPSDLLFSAIPSGSLDKFPNAM